MLGSVFDFGDVFGSMFGFSDMFGSASDVKQTNGLQFGDVYETQSILVMGWDQCNILVMC
jgi:hypothetical protein